MRQSTCAIVVGVVGAAVSTVAAQSGEGGAQRPAYDIIYRNNEDWSIVDSLAAGDKDIFDQIKHIPLDDEGTIRATFGGSYRLRFELHDDFQGNEDADDTFVLNQLRLHADIKFGNTARVFVEGLTAFTTDRDLPGAPGLSFAPGGVRGADRNELDLLQGFVDFYFPVNDGTLIVRAGRLQPYFGEGRVVSNFPWTNSLASGDGAALIYLKDGWTSVGFWTFYNPPQEFQFDDPSTDIHFYGLFTGGPVLNGTVALEAYFFGTNWFTPVPFSDTFEDVDRYTFGVHMFSRNKDGFLWEVEGAYQIGEVDGAPVHSGFATANLAYQFTGTAKPRFEVGMDFASGDNNPGGGVQTYFQKFNDGHRYLGYIDTFARQNVIAPHARVNTTFLDGRLTLEASYFAFFRASDADAVYDAITGAPIRPGSLSDETFVGHEVDVLARFQLDRHANVELGYSHFFTGDFFEAGPDGTSEDSDFFYVQFSYIF